MPVMKYNPETPAWVAGALTKALQKDPIQRYEALSAFITDLTKPNAEFDETSARPLIERSPVGFWRAFAIFSIIANLIMIYQLVR